MLNEVVHVGNLSQVLKLADGLHFRQGNLEIRDQCNSGFVSLDDSCLIIDYPQQSPDEEVLEEAESVTGLPVKYLMLTHAHVDHVMGLKTLRRSDVEIIARRTTIEQLYLEGYPVPRIHHAVEASEEFILGGRRFELFVPDTRAAHSPWDMVVGLRDESIIFAGDLVALQKNMFFHSCDIGGWRRAIDQLRNGGWSYVGRGHGPLVTSAYLDEIATYLRLLNEARDWQAEHNENVSPATVENATECLSAPLARIAEQLLQYADPVNVARQINQLYYKLR